MSYRLSIHLTHEDDTWMIRCPDVQGLLVTGYSISQVLEELPVVAQALYKACREKGWTFVAGHPDARHEDIIWVAELPQPAMVVA